MMISFSQSSRYIFTLLRAPFRQTPLLQIRVRIELVSDIPKYVIINLRELPVYIDLVKFCQRDSLDV